jgi:hypothetical protein
MALTGAHQFESASSLHTGAADADLKLSYAFGAADGSALALTRWAAGRSMQLECTAANLDFYSCLGGRTD